MIAKAKEDTEAFENMIQNAENLVQQTVYNKSEVRESVQKCIKKFEELEQQWNQEEYCKYVNINEWKKSLDKLIKNVKCKEKEFINNKIKNVIAILMCIITFLMGPISTNGKVMGNLPIPIRCNQIDVSVIDILPFQLFSLGNVEEIDLKVKKLTKFKGINMPFSDVKKLSINYEESGIDIYEMPDFGVESVKISSRGKEDNDTLRKIIVPDGIKEISVSGFDETFTQVLISESVETVNIEECEEWNHMLTYLPMSVKEINLIDNSGKEYEIYKDVESLGIIRSLKAIKVLKGEKKFDDDLLINDLNIFGTVKELRLEGIAIDKLIIPKSVEKVILKDSIITEIELKEATSLNEIYLEEVGFQKLIIPDTVQKIDLKSCLYVELDIPENVREVTKEDCEIMK